MPLTIRDLINSTLINLGVSSLDVELTAPDIVQAIHDALGVYNKYLPGKSWGALYLSSIVKRYVLTHRNIIDVLDVQFARNYRIFSGYDIIPDFTERLGEVEQWFMRRKDAMRILSTDPAWEVHWEVPVAVATAAPSSSPSPIPIPTVPTETLTPLIPVIAPTHTARELVLWVDVPENVQYDCAYLYAWRREASDDGLYGLPTIPENHTDWIQEYTLAIAKMILGRNLDKFKGLPSPAMTGLDGGELREEGLQRKNELRQIIQGWSQQVSPIIG